MVARLDSPKQSGTSASRAWSRSWSDAPPGRHSPSSRHRAFIQDTLSRRRVDTWARIRPSGPDCRRHSIRLRRTGPRHPHNAGRRQRLGPLETPRSACCIREMRPPNPTGWSVRARLLSPLFLRGPLLGRLRTHHSRLWRLRIPRFGRRHSERLCMDASQEVHPGIRRIGGTRALSVIPQGHRSVRVLNPPPPSFRRSRDYTPAVTTPSASLAIQYKHRSSSASGVGYRCKLPPLQRGWCSQPAQSPRLVQSRWRNTW
jgi:hypothetical protein